MMADRARAVELIPELTGTRHISVIGLVSDNDPDLILKSLRLGATDFLLSPFDPEQVEAALAKLDKVAQLNPNGGSGKVYCTIPAKGACGASTVACNLAYEFKRAGCGRVLLADMDALAGTLSFVLNLKSAYSFMDALNRADTLDADLWKAMVIPSNGVDVLLAPDALVEGMGELCDAASIVAFAKRHYDVTILDAGGAYGAWNLSLARLGDEILLVTTNELPALHGAQRSVNYLESNQIARWKFHVVVNRFQPEIALTREAIATALRLDVMDTLPSDYATVQKALMDGKPIAPGTALGKSIRKLANRLAGREPEPPKRTAPLGALMALFSRTSS